MFRVIGKGLGYGRVQRTCLLKRLAGPVGHRQLALISLSRKNVAALRSSPIVGHPGAEGVERDRWRPPEVPAVVPLGGVAAEIPRVLVRLAAGDLHHGARVLPVDAVDLPADLQQGTGLPGGATSIENTGK